MRPVAVVLALQPWLAHALEYASAPPVDAERRAPVARTAEPEDGPLLTVKDLRLTVGAASAPRTITTDDIPGQNGTFNVVRRGIPTAALTFSFGRLHRGGGPLIATGIDLVHGTAEAETPSGRVEFDYERYDGLIKVGYGLPLGRHAHLEILPYLGAGFGSTSVRRGGSASQSTGELGVECGFYLRAGLGCFGLVGRWNGATQWGDTTLHEQGPQAAVSTGFAF